MGFVVLDALVGGLVTADGPFPPVVQDYLLQARQMQALSFTYFGVQLWVPEVGGHIDPDNEAHDLVMSVFGGMSKGERNRIKIRVRTAMASQTLLEGRYLGERPPYGYRLKDLGAHPNLRLTRFSGQLPFDGHAAAAAGVCCRS
jgi:hypothetical protein